MDEEKEISEFKKDLEIMLLMVHKRALAGEIANVFEDEFKMLLNHFVEKWKPNV